MGDQGFEGKEKGATGGSVVAPPWGAV